MENKPVIAQRKSFKVELSPGKYLWCACGKSSTQPFCDGTHEKDTFFQPREFEITELKLYSLCGCKLTKTPPFCDGFHKIIDAVDE